MSYPHVPSPYSSPPGRTTLANTLKFHQCSPWYFSILVHRKIKLSRPITHRGFLGPRATWRLRSYFAVNISTFLLYATRGAIRLCEPHPCGDAAVSCATHSRLLMRPGLGRHCFCANPICRSGAGKVAWRPLRGTTYIIIGHLYRDKRTPIHSIILTGSILLPLFRRWAHREPPMSVQSVSRRGLHPRNPRMSALWIYSFPAFPTINKIVAMTGIIDRTRFRWHKREEIMAGLPLPSQVPTERSGPILFQSTTHRPGATTTQVTQRGWH